MNIPPRPVELKIYDKLPEPGADIMNHGVPLEAKSDHRDVVILYAPDLQSIGSIDNSRSDATTTYSLSVARGFSFRETVSIGVEIACSVNVEVVTVSEKWSLNVSFSAEWSTVVTETFSFSVPPRKLAFTYQGFVNARIMRYSPQGDKFSYLPDPGRLQTKALVTTDTPIELA